MRVPEVIKVCSIISNISDFVLGYFDMDLYPQYNNTARHHKRKVTFIPENIIAESQILHSFFIQGNINHDIKAHQLTYKYQSSNCIYLRLRILHTCLL